MFKKILALLTLLAISVNLFACTNSTGKKSDSDLTKISMLFMEGGSTPYKPDWLMLQEIEKKYQVKLDLQVVPGKDYNQKRSIVFASGDIPDIIVNAWPSEMGQYASDGILLPISTYLDKLPNLAKVIKDWNLQDTIDNISEPDGKFYILPDLRKSLTGTQCFGVREDIFVKNNIPLPETYEDLFQALVKIKAIYPETLGIGELYNGNLMMSFMAESFNTRGGFSIPFGYAYHKNENEWYYAPTSNEYFNLLTYMNKLYVNGCLDGEAFTQDASQYDQKIMNSKYMVMPLMSGASEAKSITKKLQKLGNAEAKVTALYPLAGPTGIRSVKPSSKNQGGLAISSAVSKRKDFAKVLKFFDDFYYGEEGAILSTIGVEGVTYDKVDGKYVLKSDIKTPTNPEGTKELAKDYAVGIMGLTTLVPDAVPEDVKKLLADPDHYEFSEYIKNNNMTAEDDPIVKMTTEERERAKLLITTLNDYFNQMKMKFIFNQEPLTKWDDFVKSCKDKGSDELMNIVKKAWKDNNHK